MNIIVRDAPYVECIIKKQYGLFWLDVTKCPYCCGKHRHGGCVSLTEAKKAGGHRIAHCHQGNGYNLVVTKESNAR